jgi:hypothetical protein
MLRFSPAFCATFAPGWSMVPRALAVMFLTRRSSIANVPTFPRTIRLGVRCAQFSRAAGVPRSRSARLREAGVRLEDELEAERRGNKAYEEYRVHGRMKNGRRLGAPPKPYEPPDSPPDEVNVTDPDSRVMKAFRGWVQGYNVQTAVNERQIALAGEITTETIDFGQLRPMIHATLRELDQAGASQSPPVALADAGYWNEQNMDDVTREHGISVLIPPDSSRRAGERPGWTGGRYSVMRRVLASDTGKALYRKRKHTVEPISAHTKNNRHINRSHRRGRSTVRTEWRLILMTHNLTKLHRHQLALIGG